MFLAGTPEMDAYRRDLFWAQEYARRNRAVMLALLCGVRARGSSPQRRASTSRSPATTTTWRRRRYDGVDVLVTRKGAIRAGRGDLGIIPGSMGTGSYIVRGLGNADAFDSASHGAGRRMSRTKAKQTFTPDDLAAQTAGWSAARTPGVVDEIPGAYKDIDAVMAQQPTWSRSSRTSSRWSA